MLKSLVTPAVVALLLTGAASAQTFSADPQLAAGAGVSAGRYTAAELLVIERARNDHDATTLNFYLSGGNRTASATDAGGQLAKLAGVPQGDYTVTELVNILNARTDNDAIRLAYYLSGQDRAAPAPASAVTRGEAQLATSLGVDPAQFTLAELAVMARQADQSQ